ncbi:MAG TPA: DUF4339 domain-containing protein [Pseudolabrys sp.]|nr:DUF4339 domain-containing protein [Pseudolabrys sp.]
MSDIWFYAEGEKPVGPVTLAELMGILSRVSRAGDVLVWRGDYSDWKRASTIPELARQIVRPPPLPTAIQMPDPPKIESLESSVAEVSSTPLDGVAKPESAAKKTMGVGASIFGGLIGIGLSKALGAVFWMPAILVAASFFVWKKLRVPNELLYAVALTTGHALWFVIGLVTVISIGKPNPDIFSMAIEIMVVAVLLVWIFQIQSMAAVYSLLAYQIFGIAINFIVIGTADGKIEPAMYMHVFLRISEICASIYALHHMRQKLRGGA